MAITIRDDAHYLQRGARKKQQRFDEAHTRAVELLRDIRSGSDDVMIAREEELLPILELFAAAKTVENVKEVVQRFRLGAIAPELQRLLDALAANPLLFQLVSELVGTNLDLNTLDGLKRTVRGLGDNTLCINPGTGTVAQYRHMLSPTPAAPPPTGAASVPHQPVPTGTTPDPAQAGQQPPPPPPSQLATPTQSAPPAADSSTGQTGSRWRLRGNRPAQS